MGKKSVQSVANTVHTSSNPREVLPENQLSRFIECFWETSPEGVHSLFPDGTFQLLVSHDSFHVMGLVDKQFAPGIYLFTTRANVLRIKHRESLYGLRGKIFAMSKLSKRPCDWKEIAPGIWQWKGLACLSDGNQNMQIFLEQLWWELSGGDMHLDPLLRAQVNFLLDHKGAVTIKEMAIHFEKSRQGLYKFFVGKMGVSPKVLGQIWQMNHFMIQTRRDKSLTVAALEAGYYDQAHAVKDFRKYFNESPLRYLQVEGASMLQSIEKRFSQVYDPVC